MTTSAKAAKKEKPRDALVRGRYRLCLVLKYRIELSISPYHGLVIPLNYKSDLEQDIGIEPMAFSLATRHSTAELILQIFVW